MSGFGSDLARDCGATLSTTIHRLVVIACAAAAVTVVTWFIAPAYTIGFGILHCTVAMNAVALALLECRAVPVIAMAAVAAVAPWVVHVPATWACIGISGGAPITLDFRPVVPWLSPMLLGMLAARCRGRRPA